MVSKRGSLPSPVGTAPGPSLPGWSLLAYAALVAVFVWPSRSHLTRDLLGTPGGDDLESLWNAWWLSGSLLRFESPWFTDLVFAPDGTPLVWHSLAVLPSTAIALLSAAIPVPLAYNAVLLAALPLAGLGAFLLCRHLTGDSAGSFAGAPPSCSAPSS